MSTVLIVRDPADEIAHSRPVRWAVSHLAQTLASKGVSCTELASPQAESAGADAVIVVAGAGTALARQANWSRLALPSTSEALAVAPTRLGEKTGSLACGGGERGLVYAVLEVADRIAHAADPMAAITAPLPESAHPANAVRGIARIFASDIEDKAWFYDRDFWASYLTMLAAQRFNRLHLAFGMGYDFVRDVRDAYFLFTYPFLVSVPGYDIQVVGLPDAERKRNLEMLRFISDAAAERGLHFQLGLWMHAYAWVDSPLANYTIAGLTPENHAAYCHDALQMVLDACPGVAGVTFRVHGESGVPEGSYAFWRTVLTGAVRPGRRIEVNLHPKGINRQMIDIAMETGLPVTISPKYTAEHMGLPYQQASIRRLEQARQRRGDDHFISNLMNMSEGSLRYTRYGYADFMAEDRPYGVFGRMWPGTDRLLLWGDPEMAAGFGRYSGFCGSLGLEICEPLSFKGRLGSGVPGGRTAYADPSLIPHHDFEKYLYFYRLIGRLLYDPDASPDQWRRYLGSTFGSAAPSIENALANASRVLPLVTSSHMPSAHYGSYWPEIYTNMPIVDGALRHHYSDTDEPRLFGNVSALDPAMFCKPDEFADDVMNGRRSARYSPLRVAAWLDRFAEQAEQSLNTARAETADHSQPEFQRLAVDVTIESNMGRFFAGKLRAAVAYALYQRSGQIERLREAVTEYGTARSAWLAIIEVTANVYRDDIVFGLGAHVRGNWASRLPAIDADLHAMELKLQEAEASAPTTTTDPSVDLALLDQAPPDMEYVHTPQMDFMAGDSQDILLTLPRDLAHGITVDLHYRRVNHAEEWQIAGMRFDGGAYHATIPATYTASPYALQYYFTLCDPSGRAWLYPGLNDTLSNQPYFVVRQQSHHG
jgi:hypothetical protein